MEVVVVVKDKKTAHTGEENERAVVVRSSREQNLVAALWGVVGLTYTVSTAEASRVIGQVLDSLKVYIKKTKAKQSKATATESLSLTIVCLCLGYNIQVLNLKDKELEEEVGFGNEVHVAVHVRGCKETRVGRRNCTVLWDPSVLGRN
ncbi:hypothetical protein FNV43_RR11552 [Rhamnella rubrinervis]|uniref:Uncharacterized protein n=1 Tax=Rhamnella rubrinervis TaxID=2594499 RepID=A0A8K0H684_9ROSA|nr:hypothetical protein FNV43_RR11552 [Rhamnella rubrinervis]